MLLPFMVECGDVKAVVVAYSKAQAIKVFAGESKILPDNATTNNVIKAKSLSPVPQLLKEWVGTA